jgi:hypothetical protein
MLLGSRSLSPLAFVATVAIMLAGCASTTSSDPTDAPVASPGPTSSGPPSETSPVAEPSPSPSFEPLSTPSEVPQITQTDTSWGRLWDDLPASFPVPPEATIADDATAEPVSGAFAIPGGDPAQIATWMQAALETATYSTEALSGPLEDGSFVLDSTGDGDCRIQTVVAPAGGLTLLLVRYGAACPNG